VAPQPIDAGFVPSHISPKDLTEILKDSKKVIFLTGNGICAGLGLPEYKRHDFTQEATAE
jgi:hypothetical protein